MAGSGSPSWSRPTSPSRCWPCWERSEPFAAALSRFPSTLIQGDLKLGNLGFCGDRVVMLDWGTQTGWAPPAVEVAWYLAVNWSRIDATREQVLDDFRAADLAWWTDRARDALAMWSPS